MTSLLKSGTSLGLVVGALTWGGTAQALDYPTHINTADEYAAPLAATGFVLSLDGETFVGEPEVKEIVRKVDVAMERADVQILYDDDDPDPILNIKLSGNPATGVIRVASQLNYPEFVTRGELRLIDRGAPGGPRLLATSPLAPNGIVDLPLPMAGDLVLVYRVYDKQGRFDETHALAVFDPDRRNAAPDQESSTDYTANRAIPIRGKMVTVRAENIIAGGYVSALGATTPGDRSGRAVIERILPGGEYVVDVNVVSGDDTLSFGRSIDVETAEWFYVLVADATLWRRKDGASGNSYTEENIRVQGYVDGETEGGIQITASVDTGDGSFQDIFKRLQEKDPRSVIGRLGEERSHVTFGDDSSIEDRTPTSGRVYVQFAKDNNFFLLGDYQASIDGSAYLRNERVVYGVQGHYESQDTTSNGDARASVDAFAAQPDQVVGRDVFRGTEGSLYFLSKQDISGGTAVAYVVRRDVTTGRVVERIRLEEGRDFNVNTLQGVVTLTKPLAGTANDNLIQTHADGDAQIFLEVSYEYTPIGLSTDGISAGLRAETWVTDTIRLGATVLREDSGVADQTAGGVDLRYVLGENSFVQLDYARTDGPGHDKVFSTDGGLNLNTQTANAGTGEAYKLEASIDLADVSANGRGVVGGYLEKRTQGFNTYDYSVGVATGDQFLAGLFYKSAPTDGQPTYAFHVDHVENELSSNTTEIGASVAMALSPRTDIEFAVEHFKNGDTDRTDVAARLNYAVSDDAQVYVFGQSTLDAANIRSNNRVGVGANYSWNNGWTLGAEISDSTIGPQLSLRTDYVSDDGKSYYFGYDIDPARTYKTGLSYRDNGRFVAGARRQVNEDVSVFAEQSYDFLGQRRERAGTYGLNYTPSDYLSFGATIAQGRITDPVGGDIDRLAWSLSASYDNGSLAATGRLEFRKDRDASGGGQNNTDTIVVGTNYRWNIDDDQRILASAVWSNTKADTGSLLGGEYADVSVGYALRPVDHERYNVLASLRYVLDDFGQSVDGVAGAGAVQESTILNLEGNYNLNENWTLGAKFGLRDTRSAPLKGQPLTDNDAWLLVANARMNIVNKWDALLEVRHFEAVDAGFGETGALAALYYNVGQNFKVGVGYNFTTFSDDLSDLEHDDEGLFINLIAKF